MVPVTYPPEARAAEIEGVVQVRVTIGEHGEIVDAVALNAMGFGLDEAAIEAVRGWTFEPAMQCGHAVQSTLTVRMRFALGD
jgi:TonB family protein